MSEPTTAKELAQQNDVDLARIEAAITTLESRPPTESPDYADAIEQLKDEHTKLSGLLARLDALTTKAEDAAKPNPVDGGLQASGLELQTAATPPNTVGAPPETPPAATGDVPVGIATHIQPGAGSDIGS